MTTEIMARRKAFSPGRLRHMKVLVVGLARSGVAACEALRNVGSVVKATDARSAEEFGPELGRLREMGVALDLGQHSIDFAGDCDLFVVSPGVPLDGELVSWANQQGKAVISEIELAYCLSDARFVAVTGTNGKSTTVSLLGRMLSSVSDRVAVGGNIGNPISALAPGLGSDWILVTEVSSFQLDTILSFRPVVSVLLNITPDHLDRYASYEAYVQSKARVFLNQTADDTAVINHDDENCMRLSRDVRCRKLFFSIRDELDEGAFVRDQRVVVRVGGNEQKVFLTKDLRIRGPHNLANSLAAALAATSLDFPPAAIGEAARSFEGLEHRLESVGSVGAVEFVNDSKATNLDSMRVGLEAVDPGVILIAGGRDKGSDFSELAGLVEQKVGAIVVIGEAARKISEAYSHIVEVKKAADLHEAVRTAFDLAQPSGVVLLSPGCASYDMFKDFEHRGAAFREAVADLKREKEALANG
jgi:UDP-N-acetylmuramoylalanine--D-glutamate ligase